MTTKRVTAILSTIAVGSAMAFIPLSGAAYAADLLDGTVVADEPVLQHPKWNELIYGNSSLEFHGYYRHGYGWTGDGATMPSFQAPGALSKYRLGNEEVQGGEIVIDYRYYLDGVPADKKVETGSRFIQIQGRWEEFRNIREADELFLEFTNDFTKEAFIRLGNFIDDGTHIWFGRRFYDRQDIHMIDHFWLNVAQGSDFGGGVEGIKLWGNKTVDVAAFYAYDEGAQLDAGDPTNDNINSYMLDFRLRGYSFGPDSSLTLIGQIGIRPEYDAPAGVGIVEEEIGFALGGYHELKNVWGGRNKTGFMFRQGAAMVQGDFNSRAPTELQGYDLSKAWSVEANNDLFVELAPRWSLQWATVARYEDTGGQDANSDSILWLSTGIRPMFYLTNQINIAYETGLDWVDNQRLGVDGFVWKNTVALQFQEKPGYFERPVIRLFGTYANWSDELEGHVATNSDFVNDTDGFIFGLQVETWW